MIRRVLRAVRSFMTGTGQSCTVTGRGPFFADARQTPGDAASSVHGTPARLGCEPQAFHFEPHGRVLAAYPHVHCCFEKPPEISGGDSVLCLGTSERQWVSRRSLAALGQAEEKCQDTGGTMS
ncbi:hypothetical protein GCM10027079_24080 [Sediminivirga luteola]|uniref:Uncharacterized protein n=1 Tax=Sediminivirga luteola TaxID=1774748 RepID=A0A8J2U1B2_9MICO|nr:hypothetical protein GCM10011333_33550 [Sediminivirga luteola]